MKFANFQSGGFITDTVGNPLESKLAKHTSVQECNSFSPEFYRDCTKIQDFWKKSWKKIFFFEIFLIFFSHQECNSFLPEFYQDCTKIQNFWKKKFWNYFEISFHTRSVIPFHQNFTATLPKFMTCEKNWKKFFKNDWKKRENFLRTQRCNLPVSSLLDLLLSQ